MHSFPSLLDRSHRRSRQFCAALLAAAPLSAQSSAGLPATRPDEVVALTPFTVTAEKDVGYVANDAVSGGRLSINLLQSPTDTSILTREFLDDIAAFSADAAAKWLPSSHVEEPQVDSRDWGSNVTFRGLPSSSILRNYFAFDFTPDTYIVERLEAGRGANSIIFAESAAGGRQNYSTKRATGRSFLRTSVAFDSEGSRRAAVDVSRRLNHLVSARLNLLGQEGRRWLDRYRERKSGIHFAATVRPWRDGELRVETEYLRVERTNPAYVFSDTSSLWDRSTVVNAPLTANPAAATGLSRFTNDQVVLSALLPGVVNFRNFARTNGTGLAIGDGVPAAQRPFSHLPVLPRRGFVMSPEASQITYRPTVYAATFEQKVGRVYTETAVFHGLARRAGAQMNATSSYLDVNRTLPGGALNPNFGKFYSEIQPQDNDWTTRFTGYRLAAAYPFHWYAGRQLLSAVLERSASEFNPRQYLWAVTRSPTNAALSPALTNAGNRVYYWRYWDDPGAPFSFPANRDGYEFTKYVSRDTGRESTNDTLQLATTGYYLRERLTVVAGFRFDDYTVDSRTGLFDANGYPAGNRNTSFNTRPRTASAGATFFPIPSAGVYASYNEGFQTQSDENPWVGARGPVFFAKSTGYSAGLRFRILEGALVGSAGYYQTEMANRMVNVASTRTYINQLWTDLNRSELVIAGPFSGANDTLDYRGSGWEADVTANLSKRFRLLFNVALPDAQQTNSLPDLKAYYAAHLAEWQAGANDPTNPNRTRMTTTIQNFTNVLSGYVDHRQLNGTYRWRANLFGNYQFAGALNGLRLGGGANVYGRRLLGNRVGNSFDYIYAQEYFAVTASAGYRLKIRQTSVELALNASNLLDHDEPNFSGVSVYQNVAYRGGYSYLDPRLVTFTASFTF